MTESLALPARVHARLPRLVRPLGTPARMPRHEREKAAAELAWAWARSLEEACLRQTYTGFDFCDVWALETSTQALEAAR